ncbi:branched-chain amino acid ABC transporter substrate-binding protein [Desulfovibrio ferrophilus]|uniref:Extracellular ligand-binding receptor n=1 Tax=Desulfovibrio ferrophilus TaxID=241368 RepID=A0A2Z6AZZ5_9BACT|nr:branched-chain amino acid ABC transporter substrate-binding protein [Desulfovibrio ferrophilus]BBD08788.1 extracellular ligand-binding receptor [Desulfovibrio ferrophilus]
MKKLITMTLTFAMVMSLALAGAAVAKTLNVGSMSPLTGPYAADGNDIANGVRAAIAVVQDEGGVPGFDEIKFFPQDTACDPRQAVASANKLINDEVSFVIGAYCSSSTIPASETLDEESIPMLTPASTNEKVTERGLEYMFRMCGRDDDQSVVAVAFMTNYLKGKNIYLIDDKTTYSQGLADNVEKKAAAAGIKVLGHDHVNQGDKDFSAVLAKVKAANPDVFYMSLQNSSSGALMAIQARRVGIKAAIIGQDAVYHPQLISIAKEASEGMYLTFGFIDKQRSLYKKFLMKYSEMGFAAPGAYSGYAFDAAYAAIKAIKETGSTDPDAIKGALMKMDYDGATKRIKFMPNGDSGSNYIIRKVDGGKFINYWNPETGSTY